MSAKRLSLANQSFFVLALIVLVLLLPTLAKGQQDRETTTGSAVAKTQPTLNNSSKASDAATAAYLRNLGVQLGMTADEVRNKLGHLKNKGERQDFFVFSEQKTAQAVYDTQGKMVTLSIDYMGNDSSVPTPESVLGGPIQIKPDGSMHQLKRYPEAGYWIAYSRTAGDHPITTITVQKL